MLDLRVESETYPITAAGLQADFARNDQVPFIDVVATLDPQNGQACVLMLNRDLDGERELVLEWRDVTPTRVLACETLTGAGSEGVQHLRAAAAGRAAAARCRRPPGARMTFKLPARSYTVAQLARRRNRYSKRETVHKTARNDAGVALQDTVPAVSASNGDRIVIPSHDTATAQAGD